MGAVDDGAGKWATGYWKDALHLNDRGHAELTRTLVPSLFDALNARKRLPTRKTSNGGTWPGHPPGTQGVVHSFRTAFHSKATAERRRFEIRDSAGLAAGTIRIGTTSTLTYQSVERRTIVGTIPVA